MGVHDERFHALTVLLCGGAQVTRPGDPKRFRPPGSESPIRYSPPPPGEQRKLRRLPGEINREAVKRAKAMPWWPAVKNKIRMPSSTGMYWIWIIA